MLLVGAAEQPQRPAVLRTRLLGRLLHGCNEPVGLPSGTRVVRLQMRRAVRLRARQASADGRGSPPRAHGALHLFGSGRLLLLLTPRLEELLHDFAEHRVSAQQRSGVEHLAALGATVLALLPVPVPVVLDALQAVAVAAGDRHRVPQDFQTHGATELVLLDGNSRRCHVVVLGPQGTAGGIQVIEAWLTTGVLLPASLVSPQSLQSQLTSASVLPMRRICL